MTSAWYRSRSQWSATVVSSPPEYARTIFIATRADRSRARARRSENEQQQDDDGDDERDDRDGPGGHSACPLLSAGAPSRRPAFRSLPRRCGMQPPTGDPSWLVQRRSLSRLRAEPQRAAVSATPAGGLPPT